MLQFITQPENRYSVPEQCQMVIEGGCQWIQLRTQPDSDTEMRSLLPELVSLCKETETILVIENRPEIAEEYGLHGVHVTLGSGIDPVELREQLGPHAIIGAEVDKAEVAVRLAGADIDYLTLPKDMSSEQRRSIIDALKENGKVIPVVIENDFTVDNVKKAIDEGAAGVCTGKNIIAADNPVEYVSEMIKVLNS